VDRSASYAARHAAKNVVAAGLAARCEISLAYAIGVTEPVAVQINTFGTGRMADEKIAELVESTFDFTPGGIIERLKLRKPIYQRTAREGHFGTDHPEATWEKVDKAGELKKASNGVKHVVRR
jgi:S-adenosylmethionine synthetase